MELTQLKNEILKLNHSNQTEIIELFEKTKNEKSVFPFNEFEFVLVNLISQNIITVGQYQNLRKKYLRLNQYLHLFEISAPRAFGETYAEGYVMNLCTELKKASKKTDKEYSGQYDLWLDGIRIEVKASRAVDKNVKGPLYKKALFSNTSKSFEMNFQQLKPQYCDVFIWVAVFLDKVLIWVFSSQEVSNHPLYSSGQHQGNKGNEGQLHIKRENINQLDDFLFDGKDLKQTIIEANKRNSTS